MKNLVLLFALVMTAGFVSAQDVAAKKSCAKTCTKAEKAACAKTAALEGKSASNVLSASAAADVLAEADEAISRKECPMSGKVSYFRKSECAKSGKITMEEVKYCDKSEAFVNASPSDMAKDQEAKVIKTADTVDGTVQSDSATKSKKKACCAGKKKCTSKKAGV